MRAWTGRGGQLERERERQRIEVLGGFGCERARAGARATKCWAMRGRASLPAAGEDALRC